MRRSVRMQARVAAASLAALLSMAGCKLIVAPSGQSIPFMCGPTTFAGHTFVRGSQQTEWALCFSDIGKQGLAVSGVLFRPSATAPWMTVLWEGRFADVFVPYHDGDPVYRFHDLGAGHLVALTAADCPASEGGTLRYNAIPSDTRICQEIRPYGVAWGDDSGVRRGQELVLWGMYNMGNYKMIMEWSFRDDGVIQGRAGATGYNSPGKPLVAHTHGPIWRLDLDVAGSFNDRAALLSHIETPAGYQATDLEQTLDEEAGFAWEGTQFTGMLIEDGVRKNGRGHASGYVLMPIRTGAGVHKEPFTQRSLWVTRLNDSNIGNCTGVPEVNWDLPCYANGELLGNLADPIVWYFGTLHHHPRDEDGVPGTGPLGMLGVTPVMWTGFMLIPHNVFDGSPLWP